MGEPHVISALIAKRAELAGEIQAAEKRAAQLRADLVHIDAALRVFGSSTKPEQIGPKRPYRRREWFKNGELPRLVLSALRTAERPMSARELATAAMASKGLDTSDAATTDAISDGVRSYLRRQRGRLVERVGRKDGPGQMGLWRLA